MDRTGAALLMASLTDHKRSPEFFEAWMTEEHGWGDTVANNNPANISFTGSGLPTQADVEKFPWFKGVTKVLDNRVCVYDTLEDGCQATVSLADHYFPKWVEVSTDIEALNVIGGPDINGEHWASNPDYAKELTEIYNEIVAKNPPSSKPPEDAQSVTKEYYKVIGGDCLSEIAIHHHTTVDALLKLNPDITNPDLIFVGQTIRLK